MENKKLKNLVTLAHRVSVYVPSTHSVDKPADTSAWVDSTATMLSELFGGATASNAIGLWQSPAAGLVRENVTLVYAFASELTEDAVGTIITHCENMRDTLGQEAVSMEINGVLYFI